jgi:hypothetical protein
MNHLIRFEKRNDEAQALDWAYTLGKKKSVLTLA